MKFSRNGTSRRSVDRTADLDECIRWKDCTNRGTRVRRECERATIGLPVRGCHRKILVLCPGRRLIVLFETGVAVEASEDGELSGAGATVLVC